MVFRAFSPQTTKPRCRILVDPLNHHHQVAPFHRIAFCILVIFGQLEPAGLQPLDIHYHTAVFGMEKFHELPATADEDKDIAVAHVCPHPFLHHSDQRVDSLAHVGPSGAQVIPHRIVKAEHGPTCFETTPPSVRLHYRVRSGP